MRRTFRRLLTTAALCTLTATAAHASGQALIERIVVPYAAGGVTDLYARVLAEQLGKTQDRPIIVENKPGAGGAIGTAQVAKSTADGKTLLLGSVGTATNPAMMASLPYDPADIVPVAQVAASPLILYVRNGLTTDMPQLIGYAASQPGRLSFGNSGAGSSPNLAAALFGRETGVQVTHVNYRGTSAAMTDLIGGQVDGYFDTLQAMQYVNAGKLQAVGVAASQRLDDAPQLPTLDELGVKNVHAGSWWGIFVPAGTPDEAIQALEARLRDVVSQPYVQDKARGMGAVALYRNQADFRRFFDNETSRWAAIIRAENLRIQ